MEQLNLTQDAHFPAPAGGVNPALAEPIPTSQTDAPVSGANVTEIFLPQGQVENFQLLLPMLTQLTQESRWLAWIDPPATLVQKWQQLTGIDPSRLLILRSQGQYDALELAKRALGAGTCHAVVMWTSKLTRQGMQQLEQASAQGRSHGVILRAR